MRKGREEVSEFLKRGGKAGEFWDRAAREGLTKKIHLSKDLEKERQQGMQVSGGRVFYAAGAASAKVQGGRVWGVFEEQASSVDGPDYTKEKVVGHSNIVAIDPWERWNHEGFEQRRNVICLRF